jgi:uncharacterized membrane protein
MFQGGQTPAISVKSVTMAGILTAMVIVTTMFTKIPTPLPQGYFNLGDAVVLAAAMLLGSRAGAFVGGVGSMAADIFLGGYIFAPITLVAKGLEGFVAGLAFSGGAVGKSHGPDVALAGQQAGETGQQASAAAEKAGRAPLGAGYAEHGLIGSIGGKKTLFIFLGAAVMVAVYFIAEASVLRLFDSNAFGWAAAVSELPINLVQGGVSAILARIIAATLKRARIIQ